LRTTRLLKKNHVFHYQKEKSLGKNKNPTNRGNADSSRLLAKRHKTDPVTLKSSAIASVIS
jgi:hypothetical protein